MDERLIVMTSPKRFIAGAVCPRCGEMDKIVMYREGDRSLRECVKCGYQDEMRDDAVSELPTRVSEKGPSKKENTDTQPIKFYPRPK